MRALTRFLSLLLLLGAVSACAGNRNRDPALRPCPTFVQIDNQAWLDMTIYVVEVGGSRMRIGSVSSTRTTTLRIPDGMVGPGRRLRFQADPVGSNRVATSFEINVEPGETIRLTIPPNAGR
jgi:hypothetical protein